MSQADRSPARGRHFGNRIGLPYGTLAALLLAAVLVIASATLSVLSGQLGLALAAEARQTVEMSERLQTLLTRLQDAETGQRGYLLTGQESYLAPYQDALTAIPGELSALRALDQRLPHQQEQVEQLAALLTRKLEVLRETIALRRAGDADAALAIVQTNRGQATMGRFRALVTEARADGQRLLAAQRLATASAVRNTFLVVVVGAAILLLLIVAAAWSLSRSYRNSETEIWLRAGQGDVAAGLLGERQLQRIGDKVLGQLARKLDAAVAAFHVADSKGLWRRIAGFAVADTRSIAGSGESVDNGSAAGAVAQAAQDNAVLHLRNLPAGYLDVQSSLGRGQPAELLVVPVSADNTVQGVLEFGFLRAVTPADRELLARVSESVAVAIRTARERDRIDALLGETQSQAEELQVQQEELRVSNEELEERGRALSLSQADLQNQQAELEQINTQLEEQTRMLEDQKDAMVQSASVLAEKARELETASRYKSEFLANMSHELRTPLNSTLILSKLLADNKTGNLSDDQVRYAETISAAGQDLLALINDILDLSKIESGKVEVVSESVVLARLLESLQRSFEATATERGLRLAMQLDPDAPDRIQTDGQRLGQILRNLLSNALKFTHQGEISLRVGNVDADTVCFAVRDSGIGIADDEQEAIFEAFRQADGSTHRRFGGTGLGLSISRDLARLLGGDVRVQSAPGQGSVFTLTLPRVWQAAAPETAESPGRTHARAGSAQGVTHAAPEPPPSRAARSTATRAKPSAPSDDRDRLDAAARLILVIEDDLRFAAILQDLAHEMGFQCVLTHTARDGLEAAATYEPSAILLDMNLPDHSGLGVLDQLKRDARTRHIPVHVASVADHSREARELGAVGYDIKPVKREQIVQALQGLQTRLSQHIKHLLIVEDDARQLEGMHELLAADGVEITGVATAADALTQLRQTSFDCMVMDLNLPDMSGYELLEQMSTQDGIAFPPVIVYTARMLSRDEEQRLGRYSKSIIIKDARSPERLIDEVTLFLHQVEAELPPERRRMLQAARSRDSTLQGRRVLVVEDDVRNVFALTSVLEPKGAKVAIARNGKEALEVLRRSTDAGGLPVDLVLMDIMMPEMDGYTAMREIRKEPHWRTLPIIALTAKAMPDDHQKCLDAGANDYIAKPLDVERLLSLVRVWMPKKT